MSIVLVTLAFKAELPSTAKFVLVALCDSANDQGECYPSVSSLMAKCCLSDRAVQHALASLEADGYLRREFRTGRSTIYWMTPAAPNPRTTFTPELSSPPNDVHHSPERRSPPPPNVVHPTPERGSPITVNEPSVEPKTKRKSAGASAPDAVPVSELVAAGIDEATAAEFIAHKARLKAPLTPRAWADHLREAAKAGWSPFDAAEKVMAKAWRGFEAKYVANDSRPGQPAGQAPEPAWRTEQRDRVAAFAGAAAAKRPTTTMETIDAATRFLG